MAIGNEEREREAQRVAAVRTNIQRRIVELRQTVDDRRSEATAIGRSFWDDISVNADNDDDLIETAASMAQQEHVLQGQERSYRLAQDALRKLERVVDAPYFSRIDFQEKGEQEREKIYIGLTSFIDSKTDEILIYDWRAPIASLFYDYPPGPATYRTPEMDVSGELWLKRQYIIKAGELQDVFDTGISIGDEMLQKMLSRSADEKMSSIVTTIQREQNQIIRDDQHKVLVVQGAAGSGKTSVALQRIAYLLYKYRTTLSADNMILFSPNSLFSDYVSRVLPELGEATMQQTTFQDYLTHKLTDTGLKLEDPYDQLEYILTGNGQDHLYAARLQSITYKASEAFLRVIEAYGEKLKLNGIRFVDLAVGKKVLITGAELSERFYSKSSILAIGERMEQLSEWILEQLDVFQADVQKRFYRKLVREPKYMGSEPEMKKMSRVKAHKAITPLREKAQKLAYVDVLGMYKELFTDTSLQQELVKLAGEPLPEAWATISNFTVEALEQGHLRYEDATPLVYLKGLVEGQLRVGTIRYCLVDEAQDYSPFHYAYLKKLFPRARFTLLGDWNQGIFTHANANVSELVSAGAGSSATQQEQSYSSISELMGEDETKTIRLVKSYRSTREITEFACQVLPGGEPVEPFSRSGEEPRLLRAASEQELIRLVAEAAVTRRDGGASSVAIICKTERETEYAHGRLKPLLPDLARISKDTLHYEAGVMILPAYLAKGLEFDAVILYNAGASVYAEAKERKLFYTACTRPLHYLDVCYLGELTPFLPGK
ncbi:RNA polymerase recycling motor HelD [Paenibacillus qinlingensis]|uniref:DNA helicase-2/ATP-dependent DNA helicase PcrA n=1 Tax=Paenibacillus qinlingensis TaxID=1837343 RepID=A0ABU1NXW1_9BACL|nr:RNA polymerase recycling motor HelD [Paenibacillus qinlingensis]MDR6552119.1 DNA helicase-2/ATP-dependent DNA helicase PcrA [Paenibacillus qinlingensis]